MAQTKKCIRCGEDAKLWAGNVLKSNGDIIAAGWCFNCDQYAYYVYHGSFKEEYGEEKS